MKIATAYVEVRTDKSKLDRDLGDVETSVKAKASSAAATFAKIFGAAAFGAVVKGSIDAASDLNETVSKTKVLFGEDADAVVAFSKTTAQSMGLSQRAYLDAAAGLKGLLDNLGLAPQQATEWSQKLTQLGSDLGSFFNKDPAEAVAAIGSAMRGESEPIRAFNVQINEAAIKAKALELGLYDGTGAIDSNAKAQATLALIMDQTTAAQGDFARTADGAANSQRIAKATAEDSAASLGQAFLPIYTKVVQVVTALAKGFGALPAPVQVTIVALAGLVALSGPIGIVADMAKRMTIEIKGLSATTQSAALGLGVFAGVALVAFTLRAQEAAKEAKILADSIAGLTTAATNREAVQDYFRALAFSGGDIDKIVRSNEEGAKRILEVGTASGLAQEGLDQLRAAVERYDAELRAQSTTAGDTSNENRRLTDSHTAVANSADDAAKAEADLKAATEEAARKSDVFAASLQRQLDKLAELYPKAYDAVKAKYDYADSQVAAMVAIDNTNKVLADHKSTQDDVTTATNNARDAILSQSEKYATLNGAALGSEGAIRRQIESLEATRDTLAPGSPLRAFLDQYISDLNNIPANISSILQLHIASDATNPGAPGYSPRTGPGAGPRASGGTVSRGKLYEVAEGGRPELYERNGHTYLIPGADGQVTPMGRGDIYSVNVNNNGRDLTVDDMHRVLQMVRLS